MSQEASDDDVLAFLATQPLAGLDMSAVCWRVRASAPMFRAVVGALRARMVYSHAVWMYALVHGDIQAIREVVYSHELPALVSPWAPTST